MSGISFNSSLRGAKGGHLTVVEGRIEGDLPVLEGSKEEGFNSLIEGRKEGDLKVLEGSKAGDYPV